MSWVPGGLHMALEQLISSNKSGEALAGPVCWCPSLLSLGWFSCVTVALPRCRHPWLGRLDGLQRGGRVQLLAAFPTQLWVWDHQVCGIWGLLGSCQHLAWWPQGGHGDSRARLQGPVPSLAFLPMEMLMKL